MRRWGMASGVLALVLLGAASGCSSDPEPVLQDLPEVVTTVPEYDASLEPSAAVLPLVPAGVETVEVTDFDQLRLVLGFGALTSESPAAERARFWRRVPGTAALSTGLLRPVDRRLRRDFGVSQDDVAWEASWPASGVIDAGWVIALHADTPMGGVQRAARAGVGILAGAQVDADRHLVSSSALPDPGDAWGADAMLVALSGRAAVSTYLHQGCLPFDDVFGAGMEAQLANAPAAAMRSLGHVDAFTLAMGAELATVQLAPGQRSDAFDRARLADIMPRTEPDFAAALSQPVADPASGRIGYTMDDPAAAAALTRAGTLPFAVCNG